MVLIYNTGEMKLRRIRWVGNVACMGKMRNAYNIGWKA
jgi:hypothetical protein